MLDRPVASAQLFATAGATSSVMAPLLGGGRCLSLSRTSLWTSVSATGDVSGLRFRVASHGGTAAPALLATACVAWLLEAWLPEAWLPEACWLGLSFFHGAGGGNAGGFAVVFSAGAFPVLGVARLPVVLVLLPS